MEHSQFWFVIIYAAGLCFLGAMVYMGAMIVFGGEDITIEDLEECIKQGIPPKLCIAIFYQPPLQGVNWTEGVPFP